LKKIKSALLNVGIIQGYLGFSSLGLLFKLFVDDDESIAPVITRVDFNTIRKKIQRFKDDNEPVLIGERMRSAREALDQASRLDAHCDVYRFWLSTLAVMAGNLDVARVAFENFLENSPNHPNALRLLAHLYLMPPPAPMPVVEAPAPAHSKRQRGSRVGLSKAPQFEHKPAAVPPASTKAKKVSKEDKIKAVEIYVQLLRVDPTHNDAFKALCAAYKEGLITAAAMTEPVALRLDYFPDSPSLWKFLAVLVQRVLNQRTTASAEEAQEIETRLSEWRKLVHWWKRNLFSPQGLDEMLNHEKHASVAKENFPLWLWRGVCCAILLSRVQYLKTVAYSKLVQDDPELEQQVRQAVDQFELSSWIYPPPEQDQVDDDGENGGNHG
jgi:tetratricopeptide (TPR) repeat protein